MFYQLKPELTLGECRSLRVRAGRSFQPNIPTYTCKSSSQSKQLNTICQAGVDTQVAELFQESNHQFWKKKIMTIEKPLRNSMTETWPISCFYERNILYSIIIQFNPKRRFMHMRNNTGMMKIHASKICKKNILRAWGLMHQLGNCQFCPCYLSKAAYQCEILGEPGSHGEIEYIPSSHVIMQ